MEKSTVDFLIFGEIFKSFCKSYILLLSEGKKNENRKKTFIKGFFGSPQKNIQNIGISGKKEHRRRAESLGYPNLKKLVLKAIPDETWRFHCIRNL